jgi:hypothetical protein
LLIDAPRAAKAHNQWPTVDHLAASIRAEPRPVGASDVPLEMFLALGLTLDKQSPLQTVAEPIDPSIHWIVAPTDGAKIPGFVLRESIVALVAHRRPKKSRLSSSPNARGGADRDPAAVSATRPEQTKPLHPQAGRSLCQRRRCNKANSVSQAPSLPGFAVLEHSLADRTAVRKSSVPVCRVPFRPFFASSSD